MAVQHGARQRDAQWLALLCQLRQRRPTRIAQTQQFSGFIKRLAGRIIKSFAQQGVLTHAVHT